MGAATWLKLTVCPSCPGQVRDRELAISFLHHQAVQRRVRNPFESSGEEEGSCSKLQLSDGRLPTSMHAGLRQVQE